jgi:MarR family transcriptional regulator, transcriptional regulator for hemolysin
LVPSTGKMKDARVETSVTENANADRAGGELAEADRDRMCYPPEPVGRHGNGQDTSKAAPADRSLGFLLRDTSRLMRRRFVQRAKEAGLHLNRSEALVLVHVSESPGTSQARLANALDIETISVVRLIDTLQDAGLIERRPHPTDRRIRTLWLTAAAEAALTQILAIAGFVDAQALTDISEKEHQKLLHLLDTIRSNLTPAGDSATLRSDEDAAA